MTHLRACDRRLLALIPKLRMARRRGEPAHIDSTRGCLAVPAFYQPFPAITVGAPFGPFAEPILRVERFSGVHDRPAWFQPKSNASHIALHSAYGHAVYFEVLANDQARAAAHPFDESVGPPRRPPSGGAQPFFTAARDALYLSISRGAMIDEASALPVSPPFGAPWEVRFAFVIARGDVPHAAVLAPGSTWSRPAVVPRSTSHTTPIFDRHTECSHARLHVV